jgi:hypothetical protein
MNEFGMFLLGVWIGLYILRLLIVYWHTRGWL